MKTKMVHAGRVPRLFRIGGIQDCQVQTPWERSSCLTLSALSGQLQQRDAPNRGPVNCSLFAPFSDALYEIAQNARSKPGSLWATRSGSAMLAK
jgi:hypothetical protein